ncbi:MAG: dihydroorotase [Selenomonadaceae bacterium]|nr:dihydroorotase [Selenomonadaceae bacterium]MBR6887403.1 dihydroorotase [Selenomonadaceae bacterium]
MNQTWQFKNNFKSLLLRGGRVVDPANNFDGVADVLIVDGKIAAVAPDIKSPVEKIIDAAGKIVTPGLIDMHVHLREPGQEAKEDFLSGAKAAAAGGFTTVATMPNTSPVVDNAALVRAMVKRAEDVGLVNIKIIGAVTKNQQGQELAEMRDMIAAGVVAFSDDGHFDDNAKIFLNALDYLHDTGKLIICHEEETSLVKGGVMNEGKRSALLGLKGRPTVAEDIAVARDVLLAEYTGGRVHIAHISSARAVEIVRDAKKRGVHVTAEVTPQHLTMTDDLVNPVDASTKINPPLRTQKDCDACLAGLLDGTIDAIVTDHSPHAPEEKDREYIYAPSGFPGLETSVGVLFTELYHKNKIDLKTLISKMTAEPAQIFGLDAGTLSIDAAADVTIIDPNFIWTVDAEKFYTRGSHSPFVGREFKGRAVATIVRDNLMTLNQQ